VPGSIDTAANANSTHEVVGDFDDADGNTHGFVLNLGQYTVIDVPGASVTIINGINANGEFVGTYVVDGGFPHAFLWNDGVFTTPLEPPGAFRSQAGTVNAQGQVVGTYRDSSQPARRHGFLWSKGVFTTFNVPGDGLGGTTVFSSTNVDKSPELPRPRQQTSRVPVERRRLHDHRRSRCRTHRGGNNQRRGRARRILLGCQRRGPRLPAEQGHPHASRRPGAAFTEVFGINAQGQIVGLYEDSAGNDHGFIGVPAR